MRKKQYLEVVITYQRSRYKATCAVFPKCKGYGATEEEALDALSKSIGQFIASMGQKAISSILLSQNYTEVLFKNKKPKSQKRLFPIDAGLFSKPIILSQPEKPAKEQDTNILDAYFKDNLKLEIDYAEEFDYEDSVSSANPNTEGFMFNFPMSMN